MKIIILSISLFLSTLFAQIQDNISRGEVLFQNNCASCHNIFTKNNVGPNIKSTSFKRTKQEIRAYVTKPARVSNDFGHKEESMPTLNLSSDDVYSIVEYIDSLQRHKIWMKSPVKPLVKF